MSRLRDLLKVESKPALALPGWLDRAIGVGIVSHDAQVIRRQRFANLTAFAAAANAGSHFVINAGYDFESLIVVHGYNAAFTVAALALPLLHRAGPHVAAMALMTMVALGNTFIVWMLGTDSQLHVYFTLAGVILFLFGVENWRLYVPWLLVAAGLLVACIQFAPPHGLVLPQDFELRRMLAGHAMVNTIAINVVCIFVALTALRRAEIELETAQARTQALVAAMLPVPVAARLMAAPDLRIADSIASVTVLFADLVGFTAAAHGRPPDEVVGWLDALYRRFDELAARHGVDKIKTIGDNYMAAGGLAGDPRDGALACGRLAFAMLDAVAAAPPLGERRMSLRIGLHSGPVVAGVIGETRIAYDIWGDTVNVAARMESEGVAGRAQASAAFRALAGEAFGYEARGAVEAKGVGAMAAFVLREIQPRK